MFSSKSYRVKTTSSTGTSGTDASFIVPADFRAWHRGEMRMTTTHQLTYRFRTLEDQLGFLQTRRDYKYRLDDWCDALRAFLVHENNPLLGQISFEIKQRIDSLGGLEYPTGIYDIDFANSYDAPLFRLCAGTLPIGMETFEEEEF